MVEAVRWPGSGQAVNKRVLCFLDDGFLLLGKHVWRACLKEQAPEWHIRGACYLTTDGIVVLDDATVYVWTVQTTPSPDVR